MIRIVPYESIDQRYADLAKAVVIQAAEDYKRYKFALDTINLRKYKTDEGRYKAIEIATNHIKKVEVFFKSEWFHMLSDLNGDFAFEALKETYKNEYYPIRMAEMLDETKNGRFRVYEHN